MLGKAGAWDKRAFGGLPTLYRRGLLIWSWLDNGVKLFRRMNGGDAAFCSVGGGGGGGVGGGKQGGTVSSFYFVCDVPVKRLPLEV